MNTYTIINTTSGLDLGTFSGETAYDAYLQMLRDAGYANPADVPGNEGLEHGELPGDIQVTLAD